MALTRLGPNQAINLASNTTGTLGVSNGGTGLTSGTTDQFLKFTGTTTLASNAVTPGITEYDIWRISSGYTGDANPVSVNLERCDDTGFEKIGTGMTESSGTFTFPSTGKYIIHCFWEFGANLTNYYSSGKILTTTDDGTYTTKSLCEPGFYSGGGNSMYNNGSNQYLFDVTNTSTHKIRFAVDHYNNSTYTLGASDRNLTHFAFIKVGDT